MVRLHLVVAALLLGVLALEGFAEDNIPLNYGGAPPYWTPTPSVSWEMTRSGRQPLAASTSPLPFMAIDPCRQYDSRSTSVLADNTPRAVTLIGAPCGIPADAQAVAVNITVFSIVNNPGNAVFKVGTVAPPTTAWINYGPTETQRANAGVVPLGAGGTITVQLNQGAGSVNFVVDVFGYYSPLGVVNTVNTLSGAVTLSPGTNVTITPSGQTLNISAAMPSGVAVLGRPGDTTLLGQGFTEIIPMEWERWTPTSLTNAPAGRFWHCSVWTGTKMFVWGGQDATQVPIFNSGGLYDPATDSWAMTSAGTNVPSARRYAHCVWTGSEVLVWGGEDASLVALNTGSRYNPVADTWAAITTASAPAGRFAAAAVWAAEASPPRMLVWGGGDRFTGSYVYPALGGAYNPANDTWSPISTTSQPTPRASHTFVWTGAKLVVWGGYSAPTAPWTYYNDGGLYDPSSGTWTGTAATSLSVRYAASGVWTGSRMIVWGGYNGSPLGDGALYDPVGNAWTAMTNTGAPTARNSHVAVWTGSRMIIWSGITTGNAVLNTGGIYDPAGNTWRTMTTTNAPAPSYGYKGHWTGLPLNEMVVWGGYGAVGGAYRVMSLFVKN